MEIKCGQKHLTKSLCHQKKGGCQANLLLKRRDMRLKTNQSIQLFQMWGGQKHIANCLQIGHNARTCKNEKQLPPPKPKRPDGRPRNNDFDDRTKGGRGSK